MFYCPVHMQYVQGLSVLVCLYVCSYVYVGEKHVYQFYCLSAQISLWKASLYFLCMPQILKGMMSGKYILLSAGKNIIIMLTGCATQPPAHSMHACIACVHRICIHWIHGSFNVILFLISSFSVTRRMHPMHHHICLHSQRALVVWGEHYPKYIIYHCVAIASVYCT